MIACAKPKRRRQQKQRLTIEHYRELCARLGAIYHRGQMKATSKKQRLIIRFCAVMAPRLRAAGLLRG